MNRKLAIVILVLGVALTAFFIFKKSSPRAPVKVTLRLAVSPRDQVGFVIAQATSAKFKYEIGKKAGVRPVLAQQLSVKPVPNSGLIEMGLGVETDEAGRRYAESFVDTLQAQCGTRAEVTLVQSSVR